MSHNERKEMESIQLFSAQPNAHSRMAENNIGQSGPGHVARGYATASSKPNQGAASFDNRALVKPNTTDLNQQEKYQ